jgi:hypothetical protein
MIPVAGRWENTIEKFYPHAMIPLAGRWENV